MRLETWTAVKQLIQTRVPEGPSLEYKSALSLTSASDRVEAMKDLSGMANGGGGVVIFGVEEDPNDVGAPGAIQPLTDRGVVGRLEDITRTTVSPPLLMELSVLEGAGGFILVVEVLRSPLGPHMIEAYGERRYHVRRGSRTAPMAEQDVRDAYALAGRGREHREDLWKQHALPFAPDTGAWLAISALPEEPLSDVLDPTLISLDSFRHPSDSLAMEGHFYSATASTNLRIWADGVYGDDSQKDTPLSEVFRLHRDGAAMLAAAQSSELYPTRLHGRLMLKSRI